MATPLTRPNVFGPLVTVLTGFHCNFLGKHSHVNTVPWQTPRFPSPPIKSDTKTTVPLEFRRSSWRTRALVQALYNRNKNYTNLLSKRLDLNGWFSSCLKPLFQSETINCDPIDMKNFFFHSHAIETNFHKSCLHLASYWKWEFLEIAYSTWAQGKRSQSFFFNGT